MQCVHSILVIDDDPNVREMLNQVFVAVGVPEIALASSAEGALRLLESSGYSLIVSDYRMGGMDGVEFVAQLRAAGDDTPVLLLSGAPDKAAVIRSAQFQKVEFFGKPFQIQDLMGVIERLAV